MKDSLLLIKTLRLFLPNSQSIQMARKKPRLYLVYRSKIHAVIDRIFLIFAALDCDCIEVFTVQLYRLRVWAPARSRK